MYSLILDNITYDNCVKSLSLKECVGSSGKHETQSCQLSVRSSQIIAKILSIDDYINAEIKKDGVTFFKGVIRPSATVSTRQKYVDNLEIEILDYSESLHLYVYDKIVNTSVTEQIYKNKFICNPDDEQNSLVHILFKLGSFNIIKCPKILKTCSYFKIAAGEYLDEVISDLLFENLCDYRFTKNGLEIFSLEKNGQLAEITQLKNTLQVSKKDDTQDGTIISYDQYLTYNNFLCYSTSDSHLETDLIGGFTRQYDYFPSNKPYVNWNFSNFDAGEMISAYNFYVISRNKGSGAWRRVNYLEECSETGGRPFVAYWGWFGWCLFNAECGMELEVRCAIDYYKKEQEQSSYEIPGKDPKKYTAKYLRKREDAIKLADFICKQQNNALFTYSFSSFDEFEPGTFYNLTEAVNLHIKSDIRILSRTIDIQTGLYSYTAEGADDVVITATPAELIREDNAPVESIDFLKVKCSKTVFNASSEETILIVAEGTCFDVYNLLPIWELNGILEDDVSTTLKLSTKDLIPGQNIVSVKVNYENSVQYQAITLQYIKNGLTSHLHIAYSNSADGSKDFSISDSTDKTYIGQYVDYVETDSLLFYDYKWSLFRPDPRIPEFAITDTLDPPIQKETYFAFGDKILVAKSQSIIAVDDTWKAEQPIIEDSQYCWIRYKVSEGLYSVVRMTGEPARTWSVTFDIPSFINSSRRVLPIVFNVIVKTENYKNPIIDLALVSPEPGVSLTGDIVSIAVGANPNKVTVKAKMGTEEKIITVYGIISTDNEPTYLGAFSDYPIPASASVDSFIAGDCFILTVEKTGINAFTILRWNGTEFQILLNTDKEFTKMASVCAPYIFDNIKPGTVTTGQFGYFINVFAQYLTADNASLDKAVIKNLKVFSEIGFDSKNIPSATLNFEAKGANDPVFRLSVVPINQERTEPTAEDKINNSFIDFQRSEYGYLVRLGQNAIFYKDKSEINNTNITAGTWKGGTFINSSFSGEIDSHGLITAVNPYGFEARSFALNYDTDEKNHAVFTLCLKAKNAGIYDGGVYLCEVSGRSEIKYCRFIGISSLPSSWAVETNYNASVQFFDINLYTLEDFKFSCSRWYSQDGSFLWWDWGSWKYSDTRACETSRGFGQIYEGHNFLPIPDDIGNYGVASSVGVDLFTAYSGQAIFITYGGSTDLLLMTKLPASVGETHYSGQIYHEAGNLKVRL